MRPACHTIPAAWAAARTGSFLGLFLFWHGALLLSLAGTATAAPLVFARSTVSKEYEESRLERGLKPETYVFYQGNYFEGQVVDRTLERMKFVEIARTLAPYLREQRYLPAPKMNEADLILVVHWGVTMGRNPSDALASINLDNQTKMVGANTDYDTAHEAATSGGADLASMTKLMEAERRVQDLNQQRTAEADFANLSNDLSSTSNAALMGFSDVLREESQSLLGSTTMATINAMLDEDRYFIIVLAYDRRALIEDKAIRRVWSARISLRSAGVNFREALSYLGGVGGELFGTKSEKMLIRKARPKGEATKAGDVSIGELKVIETAAPPR